MFIARLCVVKSIFFNKVCLYRLLIFLFIQKPWFSDTKYCWYGYPKQVGMTLMDTIMCACVRARGVCACVRACVRVCLKGTNCCLRSDHTYSHYGINKRSRMARCCVDKTAARIQNCDDCTNPNKN